MASTSRLRQGASTRTHLDLEVVLSRLAMLALTPSFAAFRRAAFLLASTRSLAKALSAVEPLTRTLAAPQLRTFLVGAPGDLEARVS